MRLHRATNHATLVKDLASVTASMAVAAIASSVENNNITSVVWSVNEWTIFAILPAALVTSVRKLSALATVIVTPHPRDRAIISVRLDARDVAMATSYLCFVTKYKEGTLHQCQRAMITIAYGGNNTIRMH